MCKPTLHISIVFGYLFAKNYQIWWRFDAVRTKNKLGHFLAHPVQYVQAAKYAHYCSSAASMNKTLTVICWAIFRRQFGLS